MRKFWNLFLEIWWHLSFMCHDYDRLIQFQEGVRRYFNTFMFFLKAGRTISILVSFVYLTGLIEHPRHPSMAGMTSCAIAAVQMVQSVMHSKRLPSLLLMTPERIRWALLIEALHCCGLPFFWTLLVCMCAFTLLFGFPIFQGILCFFSIFSPHFYAWSRWFLILWTLCLAASCHHLMCLKMLFICWLMRVGSKPHLILIRFLKIKMKFTHGFILQVLSSPSLMVLYYKFFLRLLWR